MTAPKILYDAHIFDILPFGGIPRYYAEIVKRISKNPDFDSKIAARYLNNEALDDFFLDNWRNTVVKSFDLKHYGRIKNFMLRANQKAVISELKSQKHDVFHPSFYDLEWLPYLGKTKLVITIHDMIPELYFGYSNYRQMAFNKARLIERADQILTVSNNTKRDLLKFFPKINPEIVTTTYLGCDMVSLNSESRGGEEYFLYVGSRDGYKNFDFLIEAISSVLNEGLMLYYTGKPPTNAEIELFRKFNVENFLKHKFADDFGLARLYAGAKALLFPSEYEGFGLPIIEAFKNNCPVVLADRSCFPEIAGDAGFYFNCKNKQSFLEALHLLDRSELVTAKNKMATDRIEMFDWRSTAQITANVYKIATS